MINVVCGIGSTGRICTDMAVALEAQGHKVKIAYGRFDVPEKYQGYAVRIGNKNSVRFNALKARLLDNEGLNAVSATKKFLKWADGYSPDMLWLHNIHGYYINYPLLFKWIKGRPQMQVKWTLHDCWAFTGHCAYFDYVGCEKWKSHCDNCVQKHSYPSSYVDSCSKNFVRKRRAFTGMENMTLITPSKWLAKLVKQSYLKDYPVEVRYNEIDTSVFKPTPSAFRDENHLQDKKVILGVASVWDSRKGIEDFKKLSDILDNNFVIVLVGLNDTQIKALPCNMIGIRKTNSTEKLAAIYTAADVLVNPTYEDNYPTVNLEAQACGTPVVTYNTGGSPESAIKYGLVVDKGDIFALKEAVHIASKWKTASEGN